MSSKPTEHFIDRHRGGEQAILVQVDLVSRDFASAEAEFRELVLSARLEILAFVSARQGHPTPQYFVGSGKAEEIKTLVQSLNAEVVIFNHELTPAQGRNLEQLFNCRVIDRSELILDIFAKRAHTFEGQLQVELAQLQHISTRLVRGWTHLERQKGGIGLRGPGETQLETDRRLINVRIKTIKKRLEKVVKQRELGRRSRHRGGALTVALVGYTNAGKSTLFNTLTEAHVYVANQLFATLDPTLRKIQLPQLGEVIMADTVGFIRDLPHDLIAAFRATLEETKQADLLLHVADVNQPHVDDTCDEVQAVLREIGANEVPQLRVFNKIDQVTQFSPRIDYDEHALPKRVWVSAFTGVGIDLLKQAIHDLLVKRLVRCEITLTPAQGKLRAQLYALNAIENESINDDGNYILQVLIERHDYERLLK